MCGTPRGNLQRSQLPPVRSPETRPPRLPGVLVQACRAAPCTCVCWETWGGTCGGVQQLDLNYLWQLLGLSSALRAALVWLGFLYGAVVVTLGPATALLLVNNRPGWLDPVPEGLHELWPAAVPSNWLGMKFDALLRQWQTLPPTCAVCFCQGHIVMHDACTPSLCCLPAHAELFPQAASPFWDYGMIFMGFALGSCGLLDFPALRFVLTTCMLELASIFLTSIASRNSGTMSEGGLAQLRSWHRPGRIICMDSD